MHDVGLLPQKYGDNFAESDQILPRDFSRKLRYLHKRHALPLSKILHARFPRGDAPCDEKGIVATALRYKDEVHDEHEYFDEIPNVKIPADMIQLAEHILESKRGHFDSSNFEDRYEDALRDLIKAKKAGKAPPSAPSPKPSNVINLMDALRRSVKGGDKGGTAASQKGGRRATHKKSAAKKKTTKAKKLKKAS